MEKTPAAFAMDWSVRLDKSLRSKNPGKCIEAIREIGANLEWWNTQPKLTTAEYNLFNLIPGEDELFANAIVLRLADAFSSGDRNTKLCVVKGFLFLYKCRRKNKGRIDGILSRSRLCNYLEVLRRVKMVFENGDVEDRVMALIFFGCWAYFSHDNEEIRYLVLSSAVSSDVMEAKAALFAGGCFCELSDDFASVLLEILVNILSSSETSMGIKLAGTRALAKVGHLISLASKAFKTGLKLLSDSSEEEFCVALLISLSKIAVKSALLNTTQLELLFTILNQGGSLQLQMTSLKCLHSILAGGVYSFHASTGEIKAIFSLLNEPKLPPSMHRNALQILHKILLQNLFNFSCPDMLEILSELVRMVENGVNFSTMSNRLLPTFVLVDICSKFMGGGEVELGGVKFHSIASWVVTFLIDRIFLLVELHPRELITEQPEVCSLLNFLLRLVTEPSDLCYMVLEKIHFAIKCLVEKHDRVLGGYGLGLSAHESHEESKTVMTSDLILKLSKVLVSCIESIGNSGASTPQVHASVKLVVEAVHNSKLFDCFTHTIYSILFWSHRQSCCLWSGVEKNSVLVRNSGIPDGDFSMQYEIFILDCSKKLLARKNYWLAYKAGRYAACQGAWFAAAFIFSQLVKLVQSCACSFWIKSLSEFTHSEMEIQFLLLPERGYGLLNWVESCGISGVSLGCGLHAMEKGTASKVISSNHIDNLNSVCKILHSSEEFLGSSGRSAATFNFQRWFLSLRVKVIENVVDMLKLLDTILLTEDKISSNVQVNGTNLSAIQESVLNVNSLVHSLTQMSIRLKKSAQEFDLMASSFIGMDCKSCMTISTLALSCSLLAFSSGFYVIISNLCIMKSSTNSGLEMLDESWPQKLILDLLSRLWNVDSETSKKLMLLLNSCQQLRNHFSNQFRNHGLDVGTETRSIINICSFAVAGTVRLQNDAHMHHVLNQSQLTRAYLQLLLNIITKWLQLPFQAPTHFFRIRPPLSAQLFTLGIDARQGTGLSISTGFHLSLNLCIQLSNMPPNLPTRLTKLYCILSTKISYRVPCPVGGETTQAELSFQDWQTDDMVDLNEKLLHYVTEHMKTSSKRTSNNAGDSGNVEAYACFEPNVKGQGFCTCLLDVSAFPVGSYRIKWHSCYIDSEGSYWSLLPLNPGPILTVQ